MKTRCDINNEKISQLLTKLTTEKNKIILKLQDKIITKKLKLLHNECVTVSIDKITLPLSTKGTMIKF